MLNVECHNYGLDFNGEYRNEMVLVSTVNVVLATENWSGVEQYPTGF